MTYWVNLYRNLPLTYIFIINLFLFSRKVSLQPQKCLPLMAFSRTRMSKVMWQVVHWWSLFTEWCPGLTVVYLHLDMPVWVRESLYDWVGKILIFILWMIYKLNHNPTVKYWMACKYFPVTKYLVSIYNICFLLNC